MQKITITVKSKGANVMTFGDKLSKLRKEKNLTQEQLANILKVSRQSVSKWESNVAYPETEKLIYIAKLFDCSTDYLLKDDCEDISSNADLAAENKTRHQRIIGYILLTVSLISGILILLFAKSEESLFFTLIIAASILCCSLICLFVKRNAGYWCAWAVASPLISFSSYIVGLNFLFRINLLLIGFYAVMFLVAKKLFNTNIIISSKRTKLLILSWVFFVALIFGLYSISPLAGIDILVNLFSHAGMALLITYTACYTKNLKTSKR